MTQQEKRYVVHERSEADVKQHGSVKKAILFLKSELNELEALWGKYSSECLGHGIICTRLKINFLTEKYRQ